MGIPYIEGAVRGQRICGWLKIASTARARYRRIDRHSTAMDSLLGVAPPHKVLVCKHHEREDCEQGASRKPARNP